MCQMLKYKWFCGLAKLELRVMHSWGEATIVLNQQPRPWQKPLKDEPFTFCLYVLPPSHCSLGHCTFLSARRFTSVLPTKWSKGAYENLKKSQRIPSIPLFLLFPILWFCTPNARGHSTDTCDMQQNTFPNFRGNLPEQYPDKNNYIFPSDHNWTKRLRK